jgi:hypothetical protein
MIMYTLAALFGDLGIFIILELIRAAYILLEDSTLPTLRFRYLSIEAVIAKGAFSV